MKVLLWTVWLIVYIWISTTAAPCTSWSDWKKRISSHMRDNNNVTRTTSTGFVCTPRKLFLRQQKDSAFQDTVTVIATEGSCVKVDCVSRVPVQLIRWARNRTEIGRQIRHAHDLSINTLVLRFRDVALSDAGYYTCEGIGRGRIMRSRIQVIVLPRDNSCRFTQIIMKRFHTPPTTVPILAHIGDCVRIRCISFSDNIVNLSWEGKYVYSNSHTYISATHSSSLQLRNISHKDTGYFACRAIFSNGESITRQVHLSITSTVVQKKTCGATFFRCATGECMFMQYHCDHKPHCSDGSDEENCPAPIITSRQATVTPAISVHSNTVPWLNTTVHCVIGVTVGIVIVTAAAVIFIYRHKIKQTRDIQRRIATVRRVRCAVQNDYQPPPMRLSEVNSLLGNYHMSDYGIPDGYAVGNIFVNVNSVHYMTQSSFPPSYSDVEGTETPPPPYEQHRHSASSSSYERLYSNPWNRRVNSPGASHDYVNVNQQVQLHHFSTCNKPMEMGNQSCQCHLSNTDAFSNFSHDAHHEYENCKNLTVPVTCDSLQDSSRSNIDNLSFSLSFSSSDDSNDMSHVAIEESVLSDIITRTNPSMTGFNASLDEDISQTNAQIMYGERATSLFNSNQSTNSGGASHGNKVSHTNDLSAAPSQHPLRNAKTHNSSITGLLFTPHNLEISDKPPVPCQQCQTYASISRAKLTKLSRQSATYPIRHSTRVKYSSITPCIRPDGPINNKPFSIVPVKTRLKGHHAMQKFSSPNTAAQHGTCIKTDNIQSVEVGVNHYHMHAAGSDMPMPQVEPLNFRDILPLQLSESWSETTQDFITVCSYPHNTVASASCDTNSQIITNTCVSQSSRSPVNDLLDVYNFSYKETVV